MSIRRTGETQGGGVEPRYRHGAGFLLATVGAMGERRWVEHLRALGLHRSEYGILAVLNEAGHALRQRDVAGRAGMDPRNAVPVVASLTARNLIAKASDPLDSRAKLVRITGDGTYTMHILAGLLADDRKDFFAALEPDEYLTLTKLLRRVYEANISST